MKPFRRVKHTSIYVFRFSKYVWNESTPLYWPIPHRLSDFEFCRNRLEYVKILLSKNLTPKTSKTQRSSLNSQNKLIRKFLCKNFWAIKNKFKKINGWKKSVLIIRPNTFGCEFFCDIQNTIMQIITKKKFVYMHERNIQDLRKMHVV